MTCVTQVSATAPLQSTPAPPTATPNISIVSTGIDGASLDGDMTSPTVTGIPQLDATSTHIGWFNVKDDFGAKGDGTTADAAAIQAAIDAAYTAVVAGVYRCGIIFFPPGVYVVGQTLKVPNTGQGTGGGGLVFMGCGGQAPPGASVPQTSWQGSQIVANFSNDLFQINVTGGGGGVTFRDLGINRVQQQTKGATFNWEFIQNGCITNVFTAWDFDVFQFSQQSKSAVNQVYIYGNQFSNVTNSFFQWVGGGGNLHIWDNVIAGNTAQQAMGKNLVGQFAFASDDTCDPFFFRNNEVEGFAGGIIFDSTTSTVGNLFDFWIEANRFNIGDNASKPCFQATASGSAKVHQGHINHNFIAVGNGQPGGSGTPNAIHLDASGGGSSQVAGIHMIGNVFDGGHTSGNPLPAAIHIANGASDITIIGGRANFQNNAIEIVGNAGTTDGITIIGFGPNAPANGYNSGTGAKNARGIQIAPLVGMTVQNITINGCNLMNCTTHGLVVDSSRGTINGITAIGNTFWGYSTPGDAVSVVGGNSSNVHIANNPGYNPVGFSNAPPTIAVGTAIPNPFPQSARIIIISTTITSISITAASGGSSITTGLLPTSQGVLVALGVGESITLGGSTGTGTAWHWFLD